MINNTFACKLLWQMQTRIMWNIYIYAYIQQAILTEHMITLSRRCRSEVLNCRTPRPLDVGSNLWALSKA